MDARTADGRTDGRARDVYIIVFTPRKNNNNYCLLVRTIIIIMITIIIVLGKFCFRIFCFGLHYKTTHIYILYIDCILTH